VTREDATRLCPEGRVHRRAGEVPAPVHKRSSVFYIYPGLGWSGTNNKSISLEFNGREPIEGGGIFSSSWSHQPGLKVSH
jgi:hypothetical protein